MGHMGRPGLSAAQKADLWQRWTQGQSLSEIGRALGTHAGSIHGVLASNGGFIPPVRRRARGALTLAEREISRGMATALSIRHIAATLGRAPSTVAREIHRHGGTHTYRAAEAAAQAWARTDARSSVGSRHIPRSRGSSRANCCWSGRPNKSRGGSSGNFPSRAPCVSLTKRSTAACSFKPEGCSRKNYSGISDPGV